MAKKIGTLLVESGVITQQQLDAALLRQRHLPGRITTHCLDLGFADEAALARVLSGQMGVPFVVLSKCAIPLELMKTFSREAAMTIGILPIKRLGSNLLIAMADPFDRNTVDEIRFISGASIVEHGALSGPLKQAIQEAYQLVERGDQQFYLGKDLAPDFDPGKLGHAEILYASREQEETPPPEPREESAESSDDFSRATTQVHITRPEAVEKELPTVMVVDDDASLREMLVEFLLKSGFRVQEASNGRQALKQLQTFLPDAIVLDAMLPGVHGFDICHRIKTAESTRHIPVIMISAVHSSAENEEQVRLLYGANAYMEKPLKLSKLKQVLENCLAVREPSSSYKELTSRVQQLFRQAELACDQGRHDLAAEHLQEALAISPFFASVHSWLAKIYVQLGEKYRAISQLEHATELEPNFETLHHLAKLYEETGFVSKARDTWDQCLLLCRDPVEAKRIRQHLDGFKS